MLSVIRELPPAADHQAQEKAVNMIMIIFKIEI
jgi:hypothetical protein